MSITKGQARKIVRTALAAATVGDLRVNLRAARTGNLRFGAGQPTTAGDVETREISVTAVVDGRKATVTGTRTDDASLRTLVGRAEDLAKISPADPEHMPALGSVKHLRVNEIDRKVVSMSATRRAEIVGGVLDVARKRDVEASGFLRHRHRARAVADKAGLFGYHASTEVDLTTTCRTRDGTGSAKVGYLSHAVGGLDVDALVTDAADRAVRSQSPGPVKPGRYTVVLAPQAVADILAFLAFSMQARSADEGRSYFSKPGGGNRIGETLFHKDVELWSDPAHPDHPSSPLAEDGSARRKVVWIKGGTLEALGTSRFWAKKTGRAAIPDPGSGFMRGDAGTVADLVAKVQKGVFVSRFWYNRMLEPRTILATGLTRDGTFLIDGGTLRPIKNLRYNESPVTVLKRLVARGAAVRAGLSSGRVTVVPPLVVEGFNFGSVSDAV